MHGSGNDFILIDHRSRRIPEAQLAHLVRGLCRRRLGIGADGVILIELPQAAQPDVDFHWRYFNADGSDGELCGNGAMCGARFAWDLGIAPAQCRFSTLSGIVQADIFTDPGDIRVAVRLVDSSPLQLDIDIDHHRFDAVTIGVPHAVTVVEDADEMTVDDFHAFGQVVRRHPVFAPAGVNVDVIHRIDDHTIRMRTYERGVEAETLACGTGAAASAFIAVIRDLVTLPVTVITSSGRPIVVEFARAGDTAVGIRLVGEACTVASGQALAGGWA
jgi:diaminopimelate epimerase